MKNFVLHHRCRSNYGIYKMLNFFILFNLVFFKSFIQIHGSEGRLMKCGSSYFLEAGGADVHIRSPNFPNSYDPDSECQWKLKTKFGSRIKIMFESFHLEESQYKWSCNAVDYLKIVDISHTTTLCGMKTPSNGLYLSVGPEIDLFFSSNFKYEYKGFHLIASEASIKCGNLKEKSKEPQKQLLSPNYPRNYPDNSLCTWKIEAPKEKQVEITCEVFQLEENLDCQADVLIINIFGDDSMKNNRKFCGKKFKPVISQGSSFNIIFKSNGYTNFKGFKCGFGFIVNSTSDKSTVDSAECGKSDLVPPPSIRIIGGRKANPRLPLVALWSFGIFCGGVLVAPQFVVTAAHCIVDEKHDTFKISIVKNYHDTPEFYNVKKIIAHENYQEFNMMNDIAILMIERPPYATYAHTACLPPKDFILEGKKVHIFGWGETYKDDFDENDNRILNTIEIPVTDSKNCSNYYKKRFKWLVYDFQFCAGVKGKDTCVGDSGSPVFINHKHRLLTVGVVSFGDNQFCGEVPGVYTRVSSFIDWIKGVIKKHKD